jgi:sucrose-6-phosphate hydrolase SacC (GH32 family)
LRELEALRLDHRVLNEVVIRAVTGESDPGDSIAVLDSDALEIRVKVSRDEAERKRFGVHLFANEGRRGLPILILPESKTIRVGTTEAPFSVADLPEGEEIELRIYIDKYLVEVFVNDRQAVVGSDMNYRTARELRGYSFGAPTTLRSVEIWRIRPTNEGFFHAVENRIWEIDPA